MELLIEIFKATSVGIYIHPIRRMLFSIIKQFYEHVVNESLSFFCGVPLNFQSAGSLLTGISSEKIAESLSDNLNRTQETSGLKQGIWSSLLLALRLE